MKNKKKDLEIVLAFGGVKNSNGEYWIGGESLKSINRKIKRFNNENILLKVIMASKKKGSNDNKK